MKGRGLAGLSAAAVIVALGAAAAIAHTESFPSTIDVTAYVDPDNDDKDTTVKGFADSGRRACVRDRVVKYFVYFDGSFEFQGRDVTNRHGRFKLKHVDFRQDGVDAQADRAKVVRRVDGSGPHRHVCEAADDVNA